MLSKSRSAPGIWIRDSIVVSISACHADDPGSIPGRGVFVSITYMEKKEEFCHLSMHWTVIGVGFFLTYANQTSPPTPQSSISKFLPLQGCAIAAKCNSEALGVGYFFKHRSLYWTSSPTPQSSISNFTIARPLGLGVAALPQPDNISVARIGRPGTWPRGVTVSTLDSESSDRGSNPREASCAAPVHF